MNLETTIDTMDQLLTEVGSDKNVSNEDLAAATLIYQDADTARYDRFVEESAIFSEDIGIVYCSLKLCGEAGEFAEKVGKFIRDRNVGHTDADYMEHLTPAQKLDLVKELGDVLWYVTALAQRFQLSLEDLVFFNTVKLISRRRRDMLKGSGDNR